MINIKPSIAQGFGKGELYPILQELQLFSAGIQGAVYFVEGNTGADDNDGLTWDTAFKTIAKAITISNTYISAQHYASRNTIFIRGTFTETLTTAPEKCDLVGVGSSNARPRPRITGSQAMTSTAWGTRFINIEFRGDAAGVTMTWTGGGFEIHNCVFSHAGTYTGTHAITIANPTDVIIKGCIFEMRNEAFFSTAAIQTTSTSPINRFKVIDCRIAGAVGVLIGATGDDNHYDCEVSNCRIYASGLPVNDNTGNNLVEITNCTLITQGAEDLTGMNILSCAGNIYTSTTDTRTFPFATTGA